ncbi:hypothetical protein R3P38DRAFT_2813780 [Favolaschia claudopus]|uniref:Uncharacterized protein n=1 Tax=Favolaschia claudopus TaxID=2862362 RepID=A0AAV9Z4D2_9AGAR
MMRAAVAVAGPAAAPSFSAPGLSASAVPKRRGPPAKTPGEPVQRTASTESKGGNAIAWGVQRMEKTRRQLLDTYDMLAERVDNQNTLFESCRIQIDGLVRKIQRLTSEALCIERQNVLCNTDMESESDVVVRKTGRKCRAMSPCLSRTVKCACGRDVYNSDGGAEFDAAPGPSGKGLPLKMRISDPVPQHVVPALEARLTSQPPRPLPISAPLLSLWLQPETSLPLLIFKAALTTERRVMCLRQPTEAPPVGVLTWDVELVGMRRGRGRDVLATWIWRAPKVPPPKPEYVIVGKIAWGLWSRDVFSHRK